MSGKGQASFDEVTDDRAHTLSQLVATDAGYRAVCSCGAKLAERHKKSLARGEFTRHLARTPYGARVRSIVAR